MLVLWKSTAVQEYHLLKTGRESSSPVLSDTTKAELQNKIWLLIILSELQCESRLPLGKDRCMGKAPNLEATKRHENAQSLSLIAQW